MRKDKSVVFQLDPEIERTVRRLQREQRNSKIVSGMNNLQDEGNLNLMGPYNQSTFKRSRINMLKGDSQTTTILFTWLMTETEL